MEEIFKKYSLLKNQNVPRETFVDFERYVSMLSEKNKEINIISKETAKDEVIRNRHIVDSAQIIEFVDLNSSIITDIGSGGGLPGIIVSIMLKNSKSSAKVCMYEKSHHKSTFLRKVSRDLKLNTEVIKQNIFEAQNLESGTIMTRAFKPLPIVIDLVYKNFNSYKNLILFMGKNGEKILEETLKIWDFNFEKKKSITNVDSFLLNIKNIEKK
ncbi:16S rRNA (guanine(527)-N(7))-methyltransferase RsmG [Candidatus Pelagibacter sp. Uisw_134_02]|uniref:16S rRNA (guanine(527)-N(7))-methyltransferase RsmG n=1 Tax=Candidatus Pelagibacter sp. Uisw_134_02 TaxID=3230990 RepID=UPI0039E89295